MGIELFSPTVAGDEGVARVVDALRQDARYELLGARTDGVTLRFTRHPPRAHWPEDVELQFGEGIFVIFHFADGQDRAGLLGLLADVLARCGRPAVFEEL